VESLIKTMNISDRFTRVLLIAAFVLLIFGVVSVVLTPIPDGPWLGMYDIFASTWIFLLLGSVSMLWAITRGTSWGSVTIFGVLLVAIVVSLSLQWQLPYGLHDAWTHYFNIKFRVLGFSANPYPGFHAYILTIGEILDIPGVSLLRFTALLAATLGVAGMALVLRRLPFGHKPCQYAFIAGLPATFLAFLDRPFTLAWVFVTFIIWILFSSIERERGIILLLGLGGLGTSLHPQLPFFTSTFFLSVAIVILLRPYFPRSYGGNSLSLELRDSIAVLGIYAVVVTGYFAFFIGSGLGILDRLIDSVSDIINQPSSDGPSEVPVSETPPASTPTTETPAIETPTTDGQTPSGTDLSEKESRIQKLFQDPSAITEVMARMTYHIMLGGVFLTSVIEKVKERDYSETLLVLMITGVQLALFFVFVDIVLNSKGTNIRRLVRLSPLLLVPGAVYALRVRSPKSRPLGAFLALMVLTGGLGTAYATEYTGGVEATATSEEFVGVQWVAKYNLHNGPVIGGTMTFWIAKGIAGSNRIQQWATTDEYAPTRIASRREGYPWQVQNPKGLVVVEEVQRALARQEAEEAGRTTAGIRDLNTIKWRQSLVYDNGGTEIYMNANPD